MEGAGKAGCSMHPQPRVQNKNSTRASHYRFTGVTRPSLRNGFTAYIVLSPANGFFATVALRVFAQDLTPAPRCQDHTFSPYASSVARLATPSVHRIPSRVDDVAQRPSIGKGRHHEFGFSERVFLSSGPGNPEQLNRLMKSAFVRPRFGGRSCPARRAARPKLH
jgi:hypothetical protein